MESDTFVRSGSAMDRGPNSGGGAAWPHEGNANGAGTGSVILGLECLLANSGARIVTNRRSLQVVWASSYAAALASSNSCFDLANGELAGRTRHSDTLLRDVFVDAERRCTRFSGTSDKAGAVSQSRTLCAGSNLPGCRILHRIYNPGRCWRAAGILDLHRLMA